MRFDPRGVRLSALVLLTLILISTYVKRTLKFVIPSVVLAFLVLWFHRDPERDVPSKGLLSPVDGRIKDIRDIDEQYTEVSVYLGLSDVHIVRSPRGGHIETIRREGQGNLPALLSMSEKNNSLVYNYQDGLEVAVMTGVIARRLQQKINTGSVSRGEKIGLISFGSRSTIRYSSEDYQLMVSKGDKITAGETIIGE